MIFPGGGSGGSIWLEALELTGSGKIEATGGWGEATVGEPEISQVEAAGEELRLTFLCQVIHSLE